MMSVNWGRLGANLQSDQHILSKIGINYLIQQGAISEETAIRLTDDQIQEFNFLNPGKMNNMWIKQTSEGKFWVPFEQLRKVQRRTEIIVYAASIIVCFFVVLIFLTNN